MNLITQDCQSEVQQKLSDDLVIPDSIGADRVAFLSSKGIDPEIAGIDLEMVKVKMRDKEEGTGWTTAQCEDAEVEYKRYLMLCRKFPYPKYSIVPNKIMDTMWHYHILDTRAYCRDSDNIFGGYFHHFPYFGMRGKKDASNLHEAFGATKHLYKSVFGEKMARTGEQSCWHDCQNRCWHACKNVTPIVD